MLIPNVIESSKSGDKVYDLWSRLLKDRIIFLGSEINDDVANILIAQFLFLEKEDPDKDIHFYINSPGGDVYAGLAIIDVMNLNKCQINTVCIGKAASMGAVLLSNGEKGKRAILPNARVMLHQLSSGFRGTLSDINVQASEANYLMDKLMNIIATNTNRDPDRVRKDCDRDYWLSAEEALEYGIVDEIMSK